ncbi:MAG: hypothetical protein DMF99_22380 [Acidobacteria bacterium]|nr:MAG: hypothetical protein DMG03_11940 [Acidobacteriota bacterium]PYR07535.1 MAG: hypothetical protein DMF99_22380 [Acidobacteriota bacterium]
MGAGLSGSSGPPAFSDSWRCSSSYLLAPAVDAIRRRINVGRRQRPLPRAAAILLVYAMLFVPGALVWRAAAPVIEQWVRVTAPAAIARVFASVGQPAPLARVPRVERLVRTASRSRR